MFRKKFTLSISMLAAVALILGSCTGKQVPGWVFMPDMYEGPSIQAYEANALFQDSLSARLPAEGSIPRGFLAYEPYSAGADGYFKAKAELKMPESVATDSLALLEGAKLYGIYCSVCHGEAGDGQGILVQNEVFLGVPSYADREINLGSIFHVVTYGKGVMGSHAAQVSPQERWKIGQYVMQLRAELTGEPVSEEAASGAEQADTTNMENTDNTQG